MTRAIVLALALGMSFAATMGRAVEGGLRASPPAVRKEVLAAVGAQLAAFRQGDVNAAYGYAAAALRAQTSVRAFAAIVQTNYPEIWSNTAADYGLVRDDGRHATVLVHVDSAGGGATYDYVLIKERNGWRIGSVVRHEPRRNGSV